jgi:hypothetical protein
VAYECSAASVHQLSAMLGSGEGDRAAGLALTIQIVALRKARLCGTFKGRPARMQSCG